MDKKYQHGDNSSVNYGNIVKFPSDTTSTSLTTTLQIPLKHTQYIYKIISEYLHRVLCPRCMIGAHPAFTAALAEETLISLECSVFPHSHRCSCILGTSITSRHERQMLLGKFIWKIYLQTLYIHRFWPDVFSLTPSTPPAPLLKTTPSHTQMSCIRQTLMYLMSQWVGCKDKMND